MKFLLRLVLATLAASAAAQSQRPAAPVQPAVEQKIPASWFLKARGYEKALALQKETGADLLVYFSRQAPADEKGLCGWFESKGLNNGKVRDYLRGYIKVQVPLPSNPDCQKLAEDFQVRKCPAVFIVQTNGLRQFCRVFDWSAGRMKLFEPDPLIELFRARSGERYQVPATGTEDPR
jgi:hypothetical protein